MPFPEELGFENKVFKIIIVVIIVVMMIMIRISDNNNNNNNNFFFMIIIIYLRISNQHHLQGQILIKKCKNYW